MKKIKPAVKKAKPARYWIGLVHRYVGLTMAAFLIIAGLTGSMLAFNDELEAIFAKELFVVELPQLSNKQSNKQGIKQGEKLDTILLKQRIDEAFPKVATDYVPLRPRAADRSFYMSVSAKAGHEIDFDQIFVNPYTGEILGTRMRGDLSQGLKNVMPFIYKLHYGLLLGGVGELIMGIIALLWTIDCLVAPYLTFPAKRRKKNKTKNSAKKNVVVETLSNCSSWLKRWLPAWKIRRYTSRFKLNYDLHRASSLWLWAVFFIFAWSSVYFNLRSMYHPVMQSVFTYQSKESKLPLGHEKLLGQASSPMSYTEAREQGRVLMSKLSLEKNFTVNFEDFLSFNDEKNEYMYSVNSSQDILTKEGKTRVWFDAVTGEQTRTWQPTGGETGDTIDSWIVALHMARVWGLPYKLFVFLLGFVTAMLCVTGVVIWMKKKRFI